ncbi:MAG: hypothetical protein LBC61_00515 [Candidatus Peribacteria bacterium]|nr:hypothetical protein [Candidatus Peribacteria bacterium]
MSLNNTFAFGGSPSQNSSTFTQNNLAAEKCPNSCTKMTIENIIIAVIIQSKSIFSCF